jgi:anaerobic magnesium-protoporphyrin IX monomethyl ester cyclase
MSFLKKLLKRKEKIVLVTPPSSFPITYARSPIYPFNMAPVNIATPLLPLGPAYIAASLEQSGYNVLVLDCTFMDKRNFDVERVKETVLNLNPDIIGLSALTWTIPRIYDLATTLKKDANEIPIVLGGPHVSALPQRTLEECEAIDATVIGEGEQTFPKFLDILFSNKLTSTLNNFKGLLFRKNGEIFGNADPVYIEELDKIPFPARHLFPISEYKKYSKNFHARQTPVASMITSRGCPHQCTFCTRANNGSRYRARSPQNVVNEMDKLKSLGFNEIQIVDDNFTHDRARVYEICKLINEKNLKMTFSLVNGMRIDHVTEELMQKMYDAGFYSIHLGVESGDDNILKGIRKGITVNQIKDAITITRKIGYELNLFFIIGLPGSTLDSEKRTLALMEELGLPFTYSVCTPYPGSPLWNELGEKMNNVSWDLFDEGDVSNPLYIPEKLTISELKEILARAKELQESLSS